MSLLALTWAFRQPVRPAAKLVLLALADHANDDGECWPGIAGLTAKTSLSDRAIQKNMRVLASAGLLNVTPRLDESGRQKSSLYRLVFSGGGERGSPRGESRAGDGSERGSSPRVNDVLPNRNRNRKNETSGCVTTTDSKCPHEEIVELYHIALPMCPIVKKLTAERRKYLRERWKDHSDLSWWKRFFEHVASSKKLTGASGRPGAYPTDFDWLIKENNFQRVIEGLYDKEREARRQ